MLDLLRGYLKRGTDHEFIDFISEVIRDCMHYYEVEKTIKKGLLEPYVKFAKLELNL